MQSRDSWYKTIIYKFLVYEAMKEKKMFHNTSLMPNASKYLLIN